MDNTKELNKTEQASPAWSIFENAAVFLFGGTAYCVTELLYRAYSHIAMFFAGGICFLLIYICEKRMQKIKLYKRCTAYAIIITAVEMLFGVIFNIILGMDIWDYSDEPFNILGQICPGFILAWMALSFAAVYLCKKIRLLFDRLRSHS